MNFALNLALATAPLVRMRSLLLCCLVLASTLTGPAALAQSGYPSRPVKLIVAFPPGGATDLIGREVAKGLQEIWGQSVIVDNKPGAAGMIAAEATTRAAPDGLTLMLATDGAMVVIPFLQEKVPYNALTDLKPIAMVAGIPLILVASPGLGVKTFGEFLAAAKANTKGIDYASSGMGGSHHMSMELLQRTTGIKLNQIAYKGGAPAMQDVLAGHVPVMWSAVSTALPHIQSGKLVPLAIGSLERSPALPNVPTVAELGYPGFEAGNWVGVVAPAGVPDATVQKIERDLQTVVRAAAYRERIISHGSEVRFSNSEQFTARVQADYVRNKAIIAAAGISKN